MNTRTIGIIILLIVLAGGAYLWSQQQQQPAEPAAGILPDQTMGMRAEENMVVAMEQRPGASVLISQVYLAAPGYVVIHEEGGAILGSSALLSVGQNDNVQVTLNRASKDGETLTAMLHVESDGNSSFSAAADVPVQSRLGGPLEGMFLITNDASDQPPVTL